MKTIYTHSEGGRELRLQSFDQPGDPLARISVDAPGERAVSHDFHDQAELAGLVAAIQPLYRAQPVAPIPPDPGVE